MFERKKIIERGVKRKKETNRQRWENIDRKKKETNREM